MLKLESLCNSQSKILMGLGNWQGPLELSHHDASEKADGVAVEPKKLE
jgi:hypothetical protein